MNDIVSLVLIVAILAAALSIMLRAARPLTGEGRSGAHRVRALRRYREVGAGDSAGLLVLALGGLAAGSVTGAPSAGAALGLLVGAASVLSAWAADLALGLIGAVAALQVAGQVVSSGGCWTVGMPARWLSVGLVVGSFAVAFLVGRHLPGNRRSTSAAAGGLGLFAVLEVVAFLVSPLGVPIAVGGPATIGTSVVVAALFGLGSGYAPVLGPLLLGAAVAIVGAGASALVGDVCSGAGSTQSLVSAMAFTAVAGTIALVRRAVRG